MQNIFNVVQSTFESFLVYFKKNPLQQAPQFSCEKNNLKHVQCFNVFFEFVSPNSADTLTNRYFETTRLPQLLQIKWIQGYRIRVCQTLLSHSSSDNGFKIIKQLTPRKTLEIVTMFTSNISLNQLSCYLFVNTPRIYLQAYYTCTQTLHFQI